MSRKDYERIAQALKDTRPENLSNVFVSNSPVSLLSKGHNDQWNNTVETIAMTLQADNSRFNKERFLATCGYSKE